MNPITIANTTKQHWIFWYRDPVNDKILKRVHINSGAQVTIGGGWSAEQKRKVIEQLERAGARDAAEAHGKLAGRFGTGGAGRGLAGAQKRQRDRYCA